MPSESLLSFVFGIFFGIVIFGLSIRLIPSSDLNVAQKFVENTELLITECEKELPRNQKCVIMAVPEKRK